MVAGNMFNTYFVFFLCFLISLNEIADSNFRQYGSVVNCSPIKSTIKQLSMKKLCYRTLIMDQSTAAYAFHPTERATDALAPCMKCPVTIHTPEYHFRFSVLVYSLETETSGNKKCSKNRLDIFNGKKNDQEYLLSDNDGLCGKSPPGRTYVSSGNSITIQLSTECARKRPPKQTANFNVVVSKLSNNDTNSCPGQFQCADGLMCIDKQYVCDDVINCYDESDEEKCPVEHTMFPPWMVALVAIATICAVGALIFAIVYTILYCRYKCSGSYAKM